jgi:hypothetical protein
MDAADGASAGSKRSLEGENNPNSIAMRRGEASPPRAASLDVSADPRDDPRRMKMLHSSSGIVRMMHSSNGRASASSSTVADASSSEHAASSRVKSVSAPVAETLMSYELVRHQVCSSASRIEIL